MKTSTDKTKKIPLDGWVPVPMRRYAAVFAAVGLYALVNPLRPIHVAILGAVIGLSVASRSTRDLAVVLVPLALFGFAYDLLRVFLERSFDVVVVEGVYRLEAFLFGWLPSAGGELGPVSYFREHHHLAVDLFGGLWYSSHIATSFAFALGLWWRLRRRGELPAVGGQTSGFGSGRLRQFVWGFVLLNLTGFVFMAIVPVAPPWYVFEYGFQPPHVPISGQPAGLARVDAFLGFDYFQGVYGQATYVFGAMPSLHVACPTWLALHVRRPWGRAVAWFYALAMGFFAVYLTHHYVVDVLAGMGWATGTYLIMRTRVGQRWCDRLTGATWRLLGGRVKEEH